MQEKTKGALYVRPQTMLDTYNNKLNKNIEAINWQYNLAEANGGCLRMELHLDIDDTFDFCK